MKKAVMDHAMAAELESPEYTPAATRRLFMDSEVYCAVISVAVAHGVAKLLDKEERRKTITAKTQAMRDFFAEMAEGEINEINGTPVLKMLDGQVNEEFGAWTPITTSLQGWVDLMKNIAKGLSTEAISELAEACRVSDSGLVTEELVERASAEFEAHVDHMCKMKYGEIDAGIEKTRAGWHEEKQEMETIMNARDNIPALPAIDGIINAAHKVLAGSKAPLCSEDVAKAINATKRATKLQIKEAEKQLKELFGLGILESNARAGGVSFYSLTVAPAPVQITAVEDDGCGACGDACASNAGLCRVKEDSPPVAAIHVEPHSQNVEAQESVLYLHANPIPHPDDSAIFSFAEKMQAKMAASREKGRSGWDDKDQVSDFRLSCDLIQHAAKGNDGTFIDVANYAMMLEQRGANPAELKKAFHEMAAEIQAAELDRMKKDPDFVILSGSDPLFEHMADIAKIAAEYLPGEEGQAVDGVRTMELLIDVQNAELIDLRKLLETERRVSGSAISSVAHICNHLGCDDHNGHIPVLRAIDAMREQITSLATDVTNTRRALNDALNEADRMRTELAIERQARQALQEQINAAPAVAPLSYKVECSGLIYIKNASDRAIKEAERLAKLHGCPATITANVPFGTVRVVKGVEFKAAKAA